jgi:hypothetical protein
MRKPRGAQPGRQSDQEREKQICATNHPTQDNAGVPYGFNKNLAESRQAASTNLRNAS